MHIVLAWFTDGTVRPDVVAQARRRFDKAVAPLVEPTFRRHEVGGDDWGVIVLHPSASGPYRWSALADGGSVTAISLGIPVGLDVPAGPVGLARQLLGGADIHREVLPPFGLIALDTDRLAIQQDWIGMCRLFTGTTTGITAFCSRPTLLTTFLDGTARPDAAAWASYAVSGFFGGDSAPVVGARLLNPGERVTGQRRPGGGWRLAHSIRYCVDDLVLAGSRARGESAEAALDLAAQGFTATMSSLGKLYSDEITLGLSGGKDSRLMAAALIASGALPKLRTNEDVPAEGEVARRLVEILAERRGLRPAHRLFRAGVPTTVLSTGLVERVERLHRRYDFQFPSSYTARAAVPRRLADSMQAVSVSGVGGELATGYWYPAATRDGDGRTGVDRALVERALAPNLLSAVPQQMMDPDVLDVQRKRIGEVIDHAVDLGLSGLELVDYVYLVERVRRWYSSAYFTGVVTPYLSPAFVMASFAVSPAQKAARVLHSGLLERYLPEWSSVPYVDGVAGATSARVSDGDGVPVLCELLDGVGGELVRPVRRDAIERALAHCVKGGGNAAEQRALQQFASIAVASRTLEPEAVRPASGEAYARVHALSARSGGIRTADRPVPAPLSALAVKLRFVKRSRVGRRVWGVVRQRVVGGPDGGGRG